MASTGYRFARYYAGSIRYRAKGPPLLALRLIAPLVVVSTVAVFASGLVLLFEGPSHRGQWVLIHKVSFIVWLAVAALHVLGHLPEMSASLRAATRAREGIQGLSRGRAWRWISLAGALAGGLLLALLLVPHFSAWTATGAFPHHGRDH
jgi:hypothetical protein